MWESITILWLAVFGYDLNSARHRGAALQKHGAPHCIAKHRIAVRTAIVHHDFSHRNTNQHDATRTNTQQHEVARSNTTRDGTSCGTTMIHAEPRCAPYRQCTPSIRNLFSPFLDSNTAAVMSIYTCVVYLSNSGPNLTGSLIRITKTVTVAMEQHTTTRECCRCVENTPRLQQLRHLQ